MKRILHLSVLLFTVVVLNSCTKDSDIFIVDANQITGPSDTWFAAVTSDMQVNNLQRALAFAADKDSFDIVNTNYTVDFNSGLRCTFPGNPFVDNSGAVATGKVTVESYLLKKKGDLIRMFKPTVSDNSLLVSGGSVLLKGKRMGQL